MPTHVWDSKLAYAVGLITSDGSLSKDQRHINLTSKDIDQILTFARVLDLKNKIGTKTNGNKQCLYYQIQFGNVKLYRFLVSIGLTPNKSKTLGSLEIPRAYFRDFLRGYLDGDGNITVARHPESKHPQLRVRFASASLVYLDWLKNQVQTHLGISGGFIEDKTMPARAAQQKY